LDHHQLASFLTELHRIVDDMRQIAIHTRPDENAWKINALLAFVNFLMVLATLGVAARTSELGKDTLSGLDQADRHHQESLSPIVVLRQPNFALYRCESNPDAEGHYKAAAILYAASRA